MTSKYKIPNPGDLIECPYDKTHMVRAERFPYHLMKCRRGYVDKEYLACPFNARHELPKPEMKYHILHCPDKVIIDQDLKTVPKKKSALPPSTFKGDTSIPRSTYEIPPCDEDWDSEVGPAEAELTGGFPTLGDRRPWSHRNVTSEKSAGTVLDVIKEPDRVQRRTSTDQSTHSSVTHPRGPQHGGFIDTDNTSYPGSLISSMPPSPMSSVSYRTGLTSTGQLSQTSGTSTNQKISASALTQIIAGRGRGRAARLAQNLLETSGRGVSLAERPGHVGMSTPLVGIGRGGRLASLQ